ncbi:MAG TPA: hypothetical protein VMF51_15935 [Nocardioides sp.]|uniref:hypothetical protein n=1 Tax=Nocardioides sp. TaxID=35761 RepID=UPI002C671C99|nr:hypothetical protein [Nocardioides sp.]HTW16629.1 hypothetical protein [Nocardioides sp.]
MSSAPAGTGSRRPRVPVERRWMGLDKRSIPYALVALAIFALWTVVVPRIDDAVAYDDQVSAGERFLIADGIVFTPTAGWQVDSGLRYDPDRPASAEQVVLVKNGVTFAVQSGDFDGTPDALLDQIDKVTTLTDNGEGFSVSNERVSLTTDAGDVGVAEAFTSARAAGSIAALVLDGTGVEIQIVGPPEQLSAVSDEIVSMVATIRRLDETGSAS